MQDIGILDGDLLVVHKTAEARTGQIVVARLGEEVTVKRLKRRGREITLVAGESRVRADRRRSEDSAFRDRRHRGRLDSRKQGMVTIMRAASRRKVPLNPGSLAQASAIELEDMPNVGKAIAGDLRSLGFRVPSQLRGENPYALYDRLNALSGARHDPCVLDTFIAAIRFMNGEPARPWWHYTAERKRTLAGSVRQPSARGG